MPLPEPRNCEYRECRAPLDPSRSANTRFCDVSCRRAEHELRAAAKAAKPKGKRPDTSYAVFEPVHGTDVQTLRLVGLTAANRREDAAEKLAEYAQNAELVVIPSRSLRTVSLGA